MPTGGGRPTFTVATTSNELSMFGTQQSFVTFVGRGPGGVRLGRGKPTTFILNLETTHP